MREAIGNTIRAELPDIFEAHVSSHSVLGAGCGTIGFSVCPGGLGLIPFYFPSFPSWNGHVYSISLYARNI